MLVLTRNVPITSISILGSLFVLQLSCYLLAENHLAGNPKHFEAGLKYYTQGRFNSALNELNQAIALSPKQAACFHARGNVYYEMHDYNRAIADYSTAVSLKSDDAAAYDNRGWAYRHIGRDGLAYRDWQTCNRILGLPKHLGREATGYKSAKLN